MQYVFLSLAKAKSSMLKKSSGKSDTCSTYGLILCTKLSSKNNAGMFSA